jgi:glutamine amidotransferase
MFWRRCELLGMSASVPTDIVFSFAGFRMRGGLRAPHKDGWGIAFAASRLHRFERKAPFSRARLVDEDLDVDFSEETTPDDRVAVIATTPLTSNETWTRCGTGAFMVFREGERIA